LDQCQSGFGEVVVVGLQDVPAGDRVTSLVADDE
jgi:hypothetical protein